MNETIWEPTVISVSLTPNPANTGTAVLLQVIAIDVFGQEQPHVWYCGEAWCGEV